MSDQKPSVFPTAWRNIIGFTVTYTDRGARETLIQLLTQYGLAPEVGNTLNRIFYLLMFFYKQDVQTTRLNSAQKEDPTATLESVATATMEEVQELLPKGGTISRTDELFKPVIEICFPNEMKISMKPGLYVEEFTHSLRDYALVTITGGGLEYEGLLQDAELTRFLAYGEICDDRIFIRMGEPDGDGHPTLDLLTQQAREILGPRLTRPADGTSNPPVVISPLDIEELRLLNSEGASNLGLLIYLNQLVPQFNETPAFATIGDSIILFVHLAVDYQGGKLIIKSVSITALIDPYLVKELHRLPWEEDEEDDQNAFEVHYWPGDDDWEGDR